MSAIHSIDSEEPNNIIDDNENHSTQSTQSQSDIDIHKIRQICNTDGYQCALYYLMMQMDNQEEVNVNAERKQTIINIAKKYNMEKEDIKALCKLLD